MREGAGPLLFARYAYPPNALGYCGPTDSAALVGAVAAGDAVEVSHLATRFEGAWPYLQLIAGCSGITDPLDHRVVEAYWVGNALLDLVPRGVLARSLDERFRLRAGGHAGALGDAVAAGGVAQHSLHVFAVYPWLGLLRAGRGEAPLAVLDRCRIRWGRVLRVEGLVATVVARQLDFVGSCLVLGGPVVEQASVVALDPPLVPGDVVSLHWDWVCDRLSPDTLGWLVKSTSRNLKAVNGLEVPGPAAVVGA